MGGGNWLTESYATNFHHFYKRKMLTGSESMADFREITNAEKTAIEASDAAWVQPSDELITRWDEAWMPCGKRFGQYNRLTGFFEGNEVKDITTAQALKILEAGYIGLDSLGSYANYTRLYLSLPTLLPITFVSYLSGISSISAKNIRLVSYYTIQTGWSDSHPLTVSDSSCFLLYSSVKQVFGILDVASDKASSHFWNGLGGKVLETLWVKNIKKNINLSKHPNFRLDCLLYMIENAANTAAIVITVHPEVFAKIADENNEEWHALLTMAAEKNIQFASA